MLVDREWSTESDVTVLIFCLASMLTIPFCLPRHVPINYVTRTMHTATIGLDCLLKQTFSDDGIITAGFGFDLSANSQSLCPWYYCSWCLSQTFIPDMEFSMKNNEITCSKTKYISITIRISYDISLWATRSGGACKKFFQKLLVCYSLYELYTQRDSQLLSNQWVIIVLKNFYLHMKNIYSEITKGNNQPNDQKNKIKTNVVGICTITKNEGYRPVSNSTDPEYNSCLTWAQAVEFICAQGQFHS